VDVLSGADRALSLARQGMGLGARIAVAGVVLLLEKVLLNLFVDSAGAQAAEGLGAVVRLTQHWGFRFLVSFAVSAAVFGYLRGGRELEHADVAARAEPPVRLRWLLAHCALLVALVPLSASLYRHGTSLPFGIVLSLWLFLAMLAAVALFAALAPWSIWRKAIYALRDVWGYAAIAAAAATSAMGWSQGLWNGMARVTFEAVYPVLRLLVPTLQVDPANRVIDTGSFAVFIDPVCSGLEGMGLMLAFCTVLLLLFRRELIFPRALLIVPAGLLLSFVLNVVRIAVLVLIGDAGYVSVAEFGFHSQAGWIAFNLAAVGIALVSLRSGWFNRAAAAPRDEAGENPTAVYLLPYMALLLAGMLSRAVSGGFERLYWLRLVFAGCALWYCWPKLRGIDWRFSWRGVLAGLAAFGLWITAARLRLPPHGMPQVLAALSSVSRNMWILGHILAFVVIVPVAEELAFRGYLLRRVRSPEFESSSPGTAGVVGLIVSTAAFALCQGVFWLPGILSGVTFGLVYMRTGRLGEAVAAHLTANALTAAAVVAGSQWQFW
jgi:exosortase E/protease (VPEID-CTERM system)